MLAHARCLYKKVRYFRGFCVSGVGGAYVFMLFNGAAYRPYFSTPTVITFGVSFELLLF
jgi:hypothetical protein